MLVVLSLIVIILIALNHNIVINVIKYMGMLFSLFVVIVLFILYSIANNTVENVNVILKYIKK